MGDNLDEIEFDNIDVPVVKGAKVGISILVLRIMTIMINELCFADF